jgi:hypothetical protein
VSRRFHIPGSILVPKPTNEPIGEITTQDCNPNPSGEGFLCDGLVVVGQQPSPVPDQWANPDGETPDGLGEEEYAATSCPRFIYGRTLTKGITVGGRLHTFTFSGTMARVGPAASPSWFAINPILDKEGWWLALQGKIKVACLGAYSPSVFGARLWVGTTTVVDGPDTDDISMVKGPNNPS